MSTLFISDLHLDENSPQLLRAFRDWARGPARRSERVYILGDLFEAWIGDDEDAPWARTVVEELAGISAAGIPLAIQHGNRDFLIGERFCRETGSTLLEDWHPIDLYGRPALLLHGDTLCTDDTAYQAFRAKVRDPQWQQGILALPLAERRSLAAQLRADSRSAQGDKEMAIMDVNPGAVEAALRSAGVDLLIHGHTHRPARHPLTLDDGVPAERIVLGDWGTHAWQLRAETDGELALEKWPV